MFELNENNRVGLKFSSNGVEQAFQEIVREKYPFEIVGDGIIILPRDAAESFKRQPTFNCKEVKIVSLFRLPPKEANKIRKKHLQL